MKKRSTRESAFTRPRMEVVPEWKRLLLPLTLLAVLTLAVLGRVLWNGFVDFDDTPYVSRNPIIKHGLTVKGLVYAFTNLELANWHPLTMISHMIDVQVFGLRAWGHHLTNLLIHVANTCLLMVLLRRMTASIWRSTLVAALFAVHPLHVQSVAWIAERKDLLSTLFALLSLHSYVTYVRMPGRRAYGMTALWLGLSLMSKAMFVTLPFLMLLLDWWPLERTQKRRHAETQARQRAGTEDRDARDGTGPSSPMRDSSGPALTTTMPGLIALVVEKLPLMLMCIAAAVMAVVSQRYAGATVTMEAIGFPARVANAMVAYATYLQQTVLPFELCVLYPLQLRFSGGQIAAAGAALAVITVIAGLLWRRRPAVLTGWLWYLGLLVPVIGLVQIGSQAHADRYTYVPLIGVFIMVVFGLPASWVRAMREQARARAIGVGAAVTVVVALGVITFREAGHWRTSQTLFGRCLQVTENNDIIRNNLGLVLQQLGDYTGAVKELSEAMRIAPEYADAHLNMGITLNHMGRFAEAIPYFERALALQQKFPEAHVNWGVALYKQGHVEEATRHYELALEQRPTLASALANLGLVRAEHGDPAGAIDLYNRALERDETADTWNNLGLAHMALQQAEQAVTAFREAVEIDDQHEGAAVNLGQALGAAGRTREAAEWLREVVARFPNNAQAREWLRMAEEEAK